MKLRIINLWCSFRNNYASEQRIKKLKDNHTNLARLIYNYRSSSNNFSLSYCYIKYDILNDIVKTKFNNCQLVKLNINKIINSIIKVYTAGVKDQEDFQLLLQDLDYVIRSLADSNRILDNALYAAINNH